MPLALLPENAAQAAWLGKAALKVGVVAAARALLPESWHVDFDDGASSPTKWRKTDMGNAAQKAAWRWLRSLLPKDAKGSAEIDFALTALVQVIEIERRTWDVTIEIKKQVVKLQRIPTPMLMKWSEIRLLLVERGRVLAPNTREAAKAWGMALDEMLPRATERIEDAFVSDEVKVRDVLIVLILRGLERGETHEDIDRGCVVYQVPWAFFDFDLILRRVRDALAPDYKVRRELLTRVIEAIGGKRRMRVTIATKRSYASAVPTTSLDREEDDA